MTIEFCDQLFDRIAGRAHIRIGGEIAGFDRKAREVFLKRQAGETIWMPATKFCDHLSKDEIAYLENLPSWDGSNEYQLNLAILKAVRAALRRFHQDAVKGDDGAKFYERIENGGVVRDTAE
jgi:hypothetical protein